MSATLAVLQRLIRLPAFALVLAVGSGSWLAAAPVDLGDDLVYVRGDEVAALSPARRAIIDLRFTPAPAAAPAWATTASPAPKVVLLAGDSARAWAERLTNRAPRVLLLVPVHSPASGDLTIPVSPAAVAGAVAAIDGGVDVPALARPPVEKRRFDESALVRHHNGDSSVLDEVINEARTEADADEAAAGDAPLADPMLQRAVQVIRGLRALGKG